MRFSVPLLFAVLFAVETFAAPLSNIRVRDDSVALEVRAAKAKKPAVKAKVVVKSKPAANKAPVAKAKPLAKTAAKKKVAVPLSKPVTTVSKKSAATTPKTGPPAKKVASTTPKTGAAAKTASTTPNLKTGAAGKKGAIASGAAKKKVGFPATKKPVNGTAAAKPAGKGKTATSCPIRKKKTTAASTAKKVAARADSAEMDARDLLIPRGLGTEFRLSSEVGAGTSNVCKKQVENIQDFEAINLRPRTGVALCGAKEHLYDYTDGAVTANLARTGFDPRKPGSVKFELPKGTTCEHILQLDILKEVMESPGGPCDQIAKKFATNPDIPDISSCEIAEGLISKADLDRRTQAIDKRTKDVRKLVAPLVKAINDKILNLAYTETDALEAQKTLVVVRAAARRPGSLNINAMSAADTPNRLKAVNDYLTRTSAGTEGLNTLQVAATLDTQIATIFPGTTRKVVTDWQNVLAVARSLA